MSDLGEILKIIDARLEYSQDALQRLIVPNRDGTASNKAVLDATATASLIVQNSLNQLAILQALRLLLKGDQNG